MPVTVRWPAFREPTVIAGIVGLGAACGLAAKVADESEMRWASDLGTFPAAWVLALALIGWLAPSVTLSAVRAAGFFVAMCLAYYAWSWFVLDFAIARYLFVWMGLAVTAVPVIAATIRWTRDRSGLFPGLALATVAAIAVADRLVWQLWWAWVLDAAPDGFPLRPFQAFMGVAVVVFVAGVLPRCMRTRLWALALIIPMTLVVAGAVDWTMSVVHQLGL